MKLKTVLSRIADNKILCFIFLVGAFTDGILFLYTGGNDPFSEMGTASLVGADHPIGFWIWSLLTAGGFYFNTRLLFKKFNCENKKMSVILVLGVLGLVAVSCTLGHFDYVNEPINAKVIIHWGGMLVFALSYGCALVWFFIKNMKKVKGFKTVGILIAAMMATLIILLIFVGKSGMLEAVPLELLLLLMFFTNYTKIFKLKKNQHSEDEVLTEQKQ